MAPKKKSTSSSEKSLSDLKALSHAELKTELALAQKNLYALLMKKELGELKQSHLMKKGRRYVAQISTFLGTTL